MAEVVNLRLARKAKARAAASKQADNNRAQFGRPLSERKLAAARREKSERDLDRHRREKDGERP
jgi:hypothetical protein